MAELARDLDTLRRSCGMSYRDLARHTGCPRSTLNDALRGRRFPRLSTVLAIARACAADQDYWRARWAAADGAVHPNRAGGTGGTGEAVDLLLSVLTGHTGHRGTAGTASSWCWSCRRLPGRPGPARA